MSVPPNTDAGRLGDIESLTDEELECLVLELTDYADHLIATRARWIPGAVLPLGYDAPGLALEAIARVLEGRRRPWDPEKEPDLTAYLKSVVKSIFSSVLQAAATRLEEVSAFDEAGNDRISAAPSANPGPDAHVIVDELKEHILARFELEEDQLVLLCLFDGVTAPAEIVEATGIAKKEINRIKQKIKRRLVDLNEEA